MRASWDETWWTVAQAVALRSRCTKRRVGAVIVGTDQRPVAIGYNGPPAGLRAEESGWAGCAAFCPQSRDGSETCFAVHAEVNALMYSDRSLRSGGTMYVTAPPCLKCSLAIANSGLGRLVCAPGAPAEALSIVRRSGLWVEERAVK